MILSLFDDYLRNIMPVLLASTGSVLKWIAALRTRFCYSSRGNCKHVALVVKMQGFFNMSNLQLWLLPVNCTLLQTHRLSADCWADPKLLTSLTCNPWQKNMRVRSRKRFSRKNLKSLKLLRLSAKSTSTVSTRNLSCLAVHKEESGFNYSHARSETMIYLGV